MERFTQIIRIASALVLVFTLAVASSVARGTALSGQVGGCPPDNEYCIDGLKYTQTWLSSCLTNHCYSDFEICCLGGIGN